jgi:hypothetical protein
MIRTSLLLVLLSLSAPAFAEDTTTPIFRGVLQVGKEMKAVFKVPGGKGPWKGGPGEKIPGSEWTLREVKMRPLSAVVEIDAKPISLAYGETFVNGKNVVAPPEPVTKVEKELPRIIPVNMGGALGPRHKAAPATPEQAPPVQKPPGQPPYHLTASGPKAASLGSLGIPGSPSVVMVTSPACGYCVKMKPKMESWATRNGDYRVVFADVGTTKEGGINWDAPVIRSNKIEGLPHFVILDARGRVTSRGDAAYSFVTSR